MDAFGGGGCLDDNYEYQKNLVKKKEDELKEIQQQIESYDDMFKQLISQKKMAVKKLADMDIQIKELNRQIEKERAEVSSKERELQEKRNQLQLERGDEQFDPFADADPFEGQDPFKSEEVNLTLPEDDPFNPASSVNQSSAFKIGPNDPFVAYSKQESKHLI